MSAGFRVLQPKKHAPCLGCVGPNRAGHGYTAT